MIGAPQDHSDDDAKALAVGQLVVQARRWGDELGQTGAVTIRQRPRLRGRCEAIASEIAGEIGAILRRDGYSTEDALTFRWAFMRAFRDAADTGCSVTSVEVAS
jgi:hypothetical protein